MSLQRRLLVMLLLCAPLVWCIALLVSLHRARHEVNELYDSEMVRLARQVQAMLLARAADPAPAHRGPLQAGDSGEADARDLAIAVWDAEGRLTMADREGVELPRLPEASGFVDRELHGEPWRIYYLQSFSGEWLVAAGQKSYEREELVVGLTSSQIVPWVLVLPLLLAALAWAVRRALDPLHRLADELAQRRADDLQPVAAQRAPAELQPFLGAMNGLFQRVGDLLERERRFTADAAHELRTPLAILRAQWDVLQGSDGPRERAQAAAALEAGLDRMDRLVEQLLALSRVEARTQTTLAAGEEIRWPPIVEQAMSDCLALASRRRIELGCDWPPAGRHPLPMLGDPHLLTVLLRNLLDNAVRYATPGTAVQLRVLEHGIELENEAPALGADDFARLGERFHRPPGQQETGSGLGLSIVRRIAALHGLQVEFGPRADGSGMRVRVAPPGPQAPSAPPAPLPAAAAADANRPVPPTSP